MDNFEFWYTTILILFMTVALIKELLQPELVVFSVLVLLLLGGVIDEKEAFAGFANSGMLTVLFLFIVAGALQKTGILNQIGSILLGRAGRTSVKLLRFMLPVAGMSAFFNNTPIVAMLIPSIKYWTKKNDRSPSKFMIPLSYAAILGGTMTLIGTSTTLVVHGLLLQNGLPGFRFFEITPIGLPVALFGLLFIALFGHHLLPARKEPMVKLGEHTREFVIEMKVLPSYRFLGYTIEQAGLRHLSGLYLFQIERKGKIIAPVTPQEKLFINDRLFFTGLPDTIIELQKTQGLSLLEDSTFDLKHYDSDTLNTFEVVISENSPLIGKNVRDSQFRQQYNAIILAIHRSGERIQKKIGDVVLHAGDTLLLLAQHGFIKEWYHSRDFYLVSETTSIPSKPRWYSIFSMTVLILMILFMATGLLPILAVVATAAIILVVTRCISPEDAQRSIEWPTLLIIASAFGISRALDNSGVATFLATKLITAIGSLGVIGLLAGVYFLTSLYTEFITNNAAAALMFPIVLAIAGQADIDARPFLLALAMAASASFATPIGYQTNMMVYGPGGYKFIDFLRVGIAMNIFSGIITITVIYFLFF
ncbi:SLC13 family permease [candidate division KSB1 bacterium]|nr:SLC13 family permease [candidate division KSB1 bacterium]RQW01313.1 MAG: SLC13 family permease [candidate division KSB1 bacterium]